MREEDLERLRRMDEEIKAIEQHALHLASLGDHLPVVEKNARSILSAIYVLKFGISDIVDVHQAR
jgi:hypothetical protein